MNSLSLVQIFGKPEALVPERDVSLKAKLARSITKAGELKLRGIEELMTESFSHRIGAGDSLTAVDVQKLLSEAVPASRRELNPPVAEHLAYLATSLDMIDAAHQSAGNELVDWIVEHYRKGQPLHGIGVCTGNSRRSVLTAVMGNTAAAYAGLPEIHFTSGGTHPSACNERTVRTLREIGIDIEATGEDAPRGDEATPNPIYRVRWGRGEKREFELLEFSKRYDDPSNPQSDFVALMVCSEADASCPAVKGASERISMPYLDPKIYDGSEFEARKYAERRDDIGRLMVSVMLRARARLAQENRLALP
ncbi:MAG TPA: hypothetical protein VHB77_13005 [Planctomycetaceae bacterium]|nr:hypothetical protein [Planctomycetaceae bacterium]